MAAYNHAEYLASQTTIAVKHGDTVSGAMVRETKLAEAIAKYGDENGIPIEDRKEAFFEHLCGVIETEITRLAAK